jgi:hypothetical protein
MPLNLVFQILILSKQLKQAYSVEVLRVQGVGGFTTSVTGKTDNTKIPTLMDCTPKVEHLT